MKKIIVPALMVLAAALAGCDNSISSLLKNAATATTALAAAGSAPMDTDGDGSVSKDEWDSFHAGLFTKLDTNGDSLLSADELKAGGGRGPGGPRGTRPPVEEIDTDGDGAISSDEWTSFHDTLFTGIDSDGDGSLSASELAAHQKDRGPAGGGPPLALMDTDGNGSVSEDEWTSFHAAQFGRIDTDHDGYLTAAEQKAAMPGGPGPQDESGMDSDGDGRISKQEWTDFHATLFAAMDANGDGSLAADEVKVSN